MISAEAAYRRCEEITWTEARNFAYGIRLLAPPKRRAMAALYAMARRIDDVGDGDWPQDRKLAALDEFHNAIGALEAGEIADPADPVLVAVAHAADHYPIPVAALHEIVEGCELDVRGETYATMDDTVRYCRLVAGSVGRLSLGVFGTKPARGPEKSRAGGNVHPTERARTVEELADDLGVALQLTNMLRDIVEDHQMGRYIPARAGAGPLRDHPRPVGAARQRRRTGPVRGGSGRDVVRAGTGATGPSRSSQPGVHRGDGRDLPAAAGSNPLPAHSPPGGTSQPACLGEGPRGIPQPVWTAAVSPGSQPVWTAAVSPGSQRARISAVSPGPAVAPPA